ncbi:peptidyl-prolyl cis-trans isomerase [Thiorhodococcus minor]|uniref:peptidylprolyl isomerase n=1 Tax=Thiorhodococcus minor TaxID=57489 RepID=A0A6M0K6V2_9GAMM|nr:peptidylprolyl isomerase [Thiorhodococcus minor]NEV64327.1 peptidyl-prolyl cis-trans isomerase [Thiorhodococcus minor]
MRRLLAEPLLHFLILGAALFLIFDLRQGPDQPSARRIVVGTGQVEQLAAQFARTWMRPPTPSELEGLVERHVRNEIYYREAQAMGLGEDDPYVRNRLALKLDLLLDDLSAETEPSDGELTRFLEAHPERFAEPARLWFRQLYLDPDRHPDPAAEAQRLLAELRAGADPDSLGDPSLLPPSFEAVTREETARALGGDFADTLTGLAPGVWSGPVLSSFGSHLVLIADSRPARQPALAEIRGAVLAEWRDARRREAKAQAYRRLKAHYEIVMEVGGQGSQQGDAVAAPLPGVAETRP